ncbi:MAG: glycosyltransferase [Collinsella sp.]
MTARQTEPLDIIKEQAKVHSEDFTVKWISFSRNFGKEAALFAGLSRASGDFVATMDADMQDPPSLLPQMYEILATEDYDSVATRRTNREGEPPIRPFSRGCSTALSIEYPKPTSLMALGISGS